MATVQERYRDMLYLMYDRTMIGQVEWFEQVEYGKTSVSAQLGNHTVTLSESQDEEGSPIETVRISEGTRRVGSFSDEDFLGLVVDVREHESVWKMMMALREKAERDASGVDVALDDVIAALNDLAPF